MSMWIRTVFIGVCLLAIIGLQVFLSRRESRWPGLILPACSFVVGTLFPFLMYIPEETAAGNAIFSLLSAWFLGNIPTIILLLIYFACRGKQRRNKQVDKMNIQDLV